MTTAEETRIVVDLFSGTGGATPPDASSVGSGAAPSIRMLERNDGCGIMRRQRERSQP